MAMILNEYCLDHIIGFLEPHDWIQTSRVCKLWKLATSKYWKSITNIEYLGFYKRLVFKDAKIISALDFGKMVSYAAPFVNVLRSSEPHNGSHSLNHVMIGHYRYKVKNLKIDNVLKFLAKKSTQLTEVYFKYSPEVSLVRQLFENNNITKFKLCNCIYGWHRDVPTQQIEELDLKFGDATDVDSVSFQGGFPKLKKLTLDIDDTQIEPNTMLSQILPFTPGIKSLTVTITTDKMVVDICPILSEVMKSSELEELSVNYDNCYSFESPEPFLKQHSTYCSKLRVLKLPFFLHVDQESLRNMLTLSQLEILKCSLRSEFPAMDLPELKYLTELSIAIFDEGPRFKELFAAVKKMPRLEKLVIELPELMDMEETVVSDLVCGVTKAATSLGKDVLIKNHSSTADNRRLIVTKLSQCEFDKAAYQPGEILDLSVCFMHEELLFTEVAKLLQNLVYDYNVFVLKDYK